MKDDQIDKIKDIIIKVLKKHGVERAAIFGSLSRNEFTDESDIDILIEFNGNRSLLDFAGLKLELQEKIGRKIDLLTYNSLHPLLKDTILDEQVVIL
jgi:predicted nucleotidyltransferase